MSKIRNPWVLVGIHGAIWGAITLTIIQCQGGIQ